MMTILFMGLGVLLPVSTFAHYIKTTSVAPGLLTLACRDFVGIRIQAQSSMKEIFARRYGWQ